MHLKIVRDKKGLVVATYEITERDDAAVELELGDDDVEDEIEVPRSYTFDLQKFYKKFRKP